MGSAPSGQVHISQKSCQAGCRWGLGQLCGPSGLNPSVAPHTGSEIRNSTLMVAALLRGNAFLELPQEFSAGTRLGSLPRGRVFLCHVVTVTYNYVIRSKLRVALTGALAQMLG